MTSIMKINKMEYTFLRYLNRSLHQSNRTFSTLSLSVNEWDQLLAMADRHEVLALLSHILESDKLSKEQQLAVQAKTARTVHKAIQLQVLNAKLTALLEKEGIQAVTLKGCTVARFYPVPEFRKTTDIDLFVASHKEAKRAVKIPEVNGFQACSGWHANHHVVLTSAKQEVVELHTAWADEFKEKHLNQYLQKMYRESKLHCLLVEC